VAWDGKVNGFFAADTRGHTRMASVRRERCGALGEMIESVAVSIIQEIQNGH